MISKHHHRLDSFDFEPQQRLLNKYEIVSFLGAGWEGEVYRVNELPTRIERAAKFFYPHRNVRNRAANYYARKLDRLRDCPILIQYRTQEEIRHQGHSVRFLVSDYVEGELLNAFVRSQPGGRLRAFEALHLLYALVKGVEAIHEVGEYHGDLHAENIIVRRRGIGFEVKLVDIFHWGPPSAANIRDDVIDLIRIFYDCLGGQRYYMKQPEVVKSICCGLKRSLISARFKTARLLRRHLERMEWDGA